ncbi:MAG: hypothetical protein WD152_03220 [Nitriliruptoraceae bacterium]
MLVDEHALRNYEYDQPNVAPQGATLTISRTVDHCTSSIDAKSQWDSTHA